MPRYSSAVIDEVAGDVNRKANWIVAGETLSGIVLGVVLAAIATAFVEWFGDRTPLVNLGGGPNFWSLVFSLVLIGLTTWRGYLKGKARALEFYVQAQILIALAQIEKNTHRDREDQDERGDASYLLEP